MPSPTKTSPDDGLEEVSEPAWDVAFLFPCQGQWSEADYLALPTNHLVELSGGVLEVPEMPGDRHQALVAFLFARLLEFATKHHAGTVRFAPLPVRLWEGKFREPDLLFLATGHEERIHEAYWTRPDLVMEVISPGTRRVDELHKVREYAKASIPEYWIVDPEAETVSVYVLEGEAYERVAPARRGESARSLVLLGLEVSVQELFDAR